MSYSLYLDDIRTPNYKFDCIAKSYNEAKLILFKRGCPSFISFDHDLSMEKTGYDFAKLLVEQDIDGIISIPDNFTFNVHSTNPVGAVNIQSYLDNYISIKKGKRNEI